MKKNKYLTSIKLENPDTASDVINYFIDIVNVLVKANLNGVLTDKLLQSEQKIIQEAISKALERTIKLIPQKNTQDPIVQAIIQVIEQTIQQIPQQTKDRSFTEANFFAAISSVLKDNFISVFTPILSNNDFGRAIEILGAIYQANKVVLNQYNYQGFVHAAGSEAQVIKYIKNNAMIEEADLEGADFSDDLFEELVDGLKSNTNLKVLDLDEENINKKRVRLILQALIDSNKTLEVLNIATDSISFKGFQTKFEQLMLTTNSIKEIKVHTEEPQEAEAFYNAIMLNNSLRSLNPFGKGHSGKNIANILNNKKNIQTLNLDACNLNDQDFSSIISALASNNSLIVIEGIGTEQTHKLSSQNLHALHKIIQVNNNILDISFGIKKNKERQGICDLIQAKVKLNNEEADRFIGLIKESKPLQLIDFHELVERQAAVKYKLVNEHNKTEEQAERLVESLFYTARYNFTLPSLKLCKDLSKNDRLGLLPKEVLSQVFSYTTMLDEKARNNLAKLKKLTLEYIESIEESNVPNLNKCLARMDHFKFDQLTERSKAFVNGNQMIIGIINENLEKLKQNRKPSGFVESLGLEASNSEDHADALKNDRKRKRENPEENVIKFF